MAAQIFNYSQAFGIFCNSITTTFCLQPLCVTFATPLTLVALGQSGTNKSWQDYIHGATFSLRMHWIFPCIFVAGKRGARSAIYNCTYVSSKPVAPPNFAPLSCNHRATYLGTCYLSEVLQNRNSDKIRK